MSNTHTAPAPAPEPCMVVFAMDTATIVVGPYASEDDARRAIADDAASYGAYAEIAWDTDDARQTTAEYADGGVVATIAWVVPA